MKKISIVFISLFVFGACSKDDDNSDAQPELTDLDALVALDKANPTNTMRWDQNEDDLSKWNGVTVKNGRVTSIVVERDKGVKVLPETISALTQLDSLIIPRNGIEKLPVEIGKLTSLIKLDLTANQLSQLPNEFSEIKESLQFLSIGGNSFKKYPTVIRGFESLTYLGLFSNELEELPAEIGNLGSLEILLIQNNKLTTLPDDIGNLSKLEELSIHDNAFESFPKAMEKLESLKELYISGADNDYNLFPQSFRDLIEKNNVTVFTVF